MNTTDRYAKIREALEMGPTPGPWTYDRRGDRKMEELPKITTVAYCCDYVIGLPSRYPGGDYRYDPSGSPEADTAFIAACDPDTIRELLAERDALAAKVERLRGALKAEIEKAVQKWGDLRHDDATRRGVAFAADILRAALKEADDERA